MKSRFSFLIMIFALAGCVARESADDAARQIEFEGQLIELNGKATPTSKVALRLLRYPSKRYHIASDCFDAGYFDDARSQYVSGSAPDVSHSGPLPLPHDRFCDSDDLARQRQLREWMFSGARISVHENDGRAVITSGTGETAVFAYRGPDLG